MQFCREQLRTAVESEEISIDYTPTFREFGVRVLDGGASSILLNVCPWCGTRLLSSLRDQWFTQLERRGVDPYGAVPPKFSDDRW